MWFGESNRYFHVSASGLFVAGGYYDTASDQIARFRRAVAEEITGKALIEAINAGEKVKLELGGHQLTRTPSGYQKDHPNENLLRYKTMTLHREFGCPHWLTTKRTKTEVIKAFRGMQPLLDWLHSNVGGTDQVLGRGRK